MKKAKIMKKVKLILKAIINQIACILFVGGFVLLIGGSNDIDDFKQTVWMVMSGGVSIGLSVVLFSLSDVVKIDNLDKSKRRDKRIEQ